jgi:hypothetical protein
MSSWFKTEKEKEESLNRSAGSRKAWVLIRARKEFKQSYPGTHNVAKLILEGNLDALEGYSKTHVATVRANLSRNGRYRDMALNCCFKCKGKKPKK